MPQAPKRRIYCGREFNRRFATTAIGTLIGFRLLNNTRLTHWYLANNTNTNCESFSLLSIFLLKLSKRQEEEIFPNCHQMLQSVSKENC